MFNSHVGPVGGGELWAYQIASTLKKHFEFRLYEPVAQNQDFFKYYNLNGFIPRTHFVASPDVYVHYSTHVLFNPKGKQNVLITCFPRKDWKQEIVHKYDKIITLSEYSRDWIKKLWNRKAQLVFPAINVYDFQFLPKQEAILSVSRFFEESDGHSKNQLELIKTFKELDLPNYELWLAGAVLTPEDENYLQKCKAEANESVKFFTNIERKELLELYGKAKLLWHANGLNRTDPYQVEHFGYIYLEAMASGCIPIGFSRGGGREFIPFTFNDLEGLKQLTLELISQPTAELIIKCRETASNYNLYKLEQKLLEAIG